MVTWVPRGVLAAYDLYLCLQQETGSAGDSRAVVGDIAMTKVEDRLINPTEFDSPATVSLRQRALDTFDVESCGRLRALFVRTARGKCRRSCGYGRKSWPNLPEYRRDPALGNMSDAVKTAWWESTAQFRALAPAMRATFGATYQRRLAVIALWDAEGVPMMAGTDGKGDVPGQALQQEFRELAKVGLSPLKILAMTTIEPTRFLGRAKSMRRLVADIVLLEADPLTHVENLGSISAVVRRGHYVPRSRLDENVIERRRVA